MKVSCPVLQNAKFIPSRFAYRGVQGGQNVSLPVSWTDAPAATRSFALSMIDRHPIANNWIHWYVINISASAVELPEGASGTREKMPAGSIELRNTYGETGYGGPKPPRGTGPHEYVITVHALTVDKLDLSPKSTPEERARALEGKVIGSASVVGIFQQ